MKSCLRNRFWMGVFLLLGWMTFFNSVVAQDRVQEDSIKMYLNKAVQLPLSALDSSISLTYKAFKNTSVDQPGLRFRSLDLLSLLYLDKGEVDSAFLYALKAKDFAESVENDSLLAAAFNNLKIIHFEMGDLEESEYYARKVLELDEKYGFPKLKSEAYWALALIHSNKYNVKTLTQEQRDKEYQKSKSYFQKALSGNVITTLDSIDIYNSMSILEADHGNYELAVDYMLEVADYYKNRGDTMWLANVYNNLGYTYFEMGKNQLAEDYLISAWNLVRNTPLWMERSYISESLYEFYDSLENHEQALFYFKQHDESEEKIESGRFQQNLELIESQYENQLLTAENDRRQKRLENQFLIMVIGLTLLLSLIIILVILYYGKKRQDELLNKVKDSNAKLEELNQFKDKILSVISHDFKSPLNNLQVAISLAREEDLSSDEYKLILNGIDDQLTRTQIFLQNILLWARNQIKGYKVEKRSFNFDELANESMDLLMEQINRKKLKVIKNYKEDQQLYTDRDILLIVFRNLLQNAIKYSRENESIAINLKRENDHDILSVIDSGVGMQKEVIDKLFTYELESAGGTQLEKGAGIGLLLSRDLLELVGGKIEVYSVQNQGSEFMVKLPRS